MFCFERTGYPSSVHAWGAKFEQELSPQYWL